MVMCHGKSCYKLDFECKTATFCTENGHFSKSKIQIGMICQIEQNCQRKFRGIGILATLRSIPKDHVLVPWFFGHLSIFFFLLIPCFFKSIPLSRQKLLPHLYKKFQVRLGVNKTKLSHISSKEDFMHFISAGVL